MYDPQHFADLHETGGYGDPNSWLSGGGDHSSPAMLRSQSSLSTAAAGSNVDRELYKDLVQMVPLVQSLIDRAGKSSYTRQGSMICTKTPSRESLHRKSVDPKARKTAQSVPIKKRKDKTDKDQANAGGVGKDEMSDNLLASSRTSSADLDKDELIALRVQVQDLQNKILEKDELLKLAENTKTQMSATYAELQELRLKAAKQDSCIKSTEMQLSDAKIKLADKQAAVEKLQWELTASNKKVEKLQEDIGSTRGDISSFMSLFEGLAKNTRIMATEDYDVISCQLPHSDDRDEAEMQRMEEARLSYIAAVDLAKEKQDEDSIAAAANARLHLNSFLSNEIK